MPAPTPANDTGTTRVTITLPRGLVGTARVAVLDGDATCHLSDEAAVAALTFSYLTLARLLPEPLRRDLEPLVSRLEKRDHQHADDALDESCCPDCGSLLDHEWRDGEIHEYGGTYAQEPGYSFAFCPVCDWAEED